MSNILDTNAYILTTYIVLPDKVNYINWYKLINMEDKMGKDSMPASTPYESPEVQKVSPLATKISNPEAETAAMRATLIKQSKKKGRQSTVSAGGQNKFEVTDGNYSKLLGD